MGFEPMASCYFGIEFVQSRRSTADLSALKNSYRNYSLNILTTDVVLATAYGSHTLSAAIHSFFYLHLAGA